jgi:hypothetical protein
MKVLFVLGFVPQPNLRGGVSFLKWGHPCDIFGEAIDDKMAVADLKQDFANGIMTEYQ